MPWTPDETEGNPERQQSKGSSAPGRYSEVNFSPPMGSLGWISRYRGAAAAANNNNKFLLIKVIWVSCRYKHQDHAQNI